MDTNTCRRDCFHVVSVPWRQARRMRNLIQSLASRVCLERATVQSGHIGVRSASEHRYRWLVTVRGLVCLEVCVASRTSDLFKQLESRSLTEDEQAIIEQRVPNLLNSIRAVAVLLPAESCHDQTVFVDAANVATQDAEGLRVARESSQGRCRRTEQQHAALHDLTLSKEIVKHAFGTSLPSGAGH